MPYSRLSRSFGAATITPLVVALLALAACGGSGGVATETATPSRSVAGAGSGTPAPTHTWTPGAKPIPAVTIPAQKATTDLGEATTGWEFKPTVDIQATDLGYYDDGGNGLRHSHPVGIFDSATKRLLVTATVRPQDPLEASYRFAKIGPLKLEAGRSYMVAAFAIKPFDPEVPHADRLDWAPEIEYLGNRMWPAEGGLSYPGMIEDVLCATANFKYTPLSVASPAP